MTTTQTNPSAARTNGNGEKTKNARTRKPLTARAVASKIADLIEKFPADQRDKVLALAKTMIDAGV